MTDETELKLELAADAAERLAASPMFSGDSTSVKQRSVYFDTPDHKLQAAGFSLRIRTAGGVRTQTVKADSSKAAGLFVRPEWEFSIAGDAPVLDHSTPILSVLGAAAKTVTAQFEVHVERRTWLLSLDGAEIEAVLDVGEVVAGDRRTSISEMELELKNGGPASALFEIARKAAAAVPVRPGVLSKCERGYRLLGSAATLFKAEPVRLDVHMTAAASFQQIAHACVSQYRLNEAVLLVRRDPETLHQARVSLRRLRSAFSIFKDVVGDEQSEHLGNEARWLAGVLGQARDIDVMMGKVEDPDLHARLSQAANAAYDEVEAALESDRVRAFMLDLVEWLASGLWLEASETAELRLSPALDFASTALDRLRRRLKKHGRGLAGLEDEARHEVRKDAKKLRYASEFFAMLYADKRGKRRHKRYIAVLEDLQDQLGALNDMAAGSQLLAKLELSNDPAASSLIVKGGRKSLLAAAEDAYVDLLDAKRFWR